jgi:hypothetical protein
LCCGTTLAVHHKPDRLHGSNCGLLLLKTQFASSAMACQATALSPSSYAPYIWVTLKNHSSVPL